MCGDAIHARMPHLEPFASLRYADDVRLPAVLAPPYDVISDAMRAQLATDPHNVVHLTLPLAGSGQSSSAQSTPAQDRYDRAAETLQRWRSDGTLVAEEPALWLLEQTSVADGQPRTVRGLLAAVATAEVLPHELVYETIVSDRLDLLRATACELEAILAIYDGAGGGARALLDAVQASPPTLEIRTPFDGDLHRLWRIEGTPKITNLIEDLAPRVTVIADGHHRWTTMKRYAAERGLDGTQLMLLQDIGVQPPALLAIHRTLQGVTLEDARQALADRFVIEEVARAPERLASDLAGSSSPALVFFDARTAFRCEPKDDLEDLFPSETGPVRRRLDVAILHDAILASLLPSAEPGYVHSPGEAAKATDDLTTVAVLLRPTPLASVLEVAASGEPMPRKSTFFLPKPASGFLFRPR